MSSTNAMNFVQKSYYVVICVLVLVENVNKADCTYRVKKCVTRSILAIIRTCILFNICYLYNIYLHINHKIVYDFTNGCHFYIDAIIHAKKRVLRAKKNVLTLVHTLNVHFRVVLRAFHVRYSRRDSSQYIIYFF